MSMHVMNRHFVPFRIPWLELEGDNVVADRQRLRYRDNVLQPRGLIDLDRGLSNASFRDYLEEHNPCRFVPDTIEVQNSVEDKSLYELLKMLRDGNSRGYRYWHEIRSVRLVCKP